MARSHGKSSNYAIHCYRYNSNSNIQRCQYLEFKGAQGGAKPPRVTYTTVLSVKMTFFSYLHTRPVVFLFSSRLFLLASGTGLKPVCVRPCCASTLLFILHEFYSTFSCYLVSLLDNDFPKMSSKVSKMLSTDFFRKFSLSNSNLEFSLSGTECYNGSRRLTSLLHQSLSKLSNRAISNKCELRTGCRRSAHDKK